VADVKLSFVIPTYNYGCYINNCLQSITEQGIDNYEIIVVDDGSTDDTRNIVEEYSQRIYLGQLRYIYQVNRGPSAARNNGATEAQGEFVWFIDADDRLVPGAMAVVLKALDKFDQVDFLFGGHFYVNDKGQKMVRQAIPIGSDRNDNFEKYIRNKNHGISIGSLIVRSTLFERFGFPEGVHNSEDFIFFGHLIANCQGASILNIIVEKICHKDSLRYNLLAIKQSGVAVDYLFDEKFLNVRQMAFKNIYHSRRCLYMFRTLYRDKDYKSALLFYLRSIYISPQCILNLRRVKQAIRCVAKIVLSKFS